MLSVRWCWWRCRRRWPNRSDSAMRWCRLWSSYHLPFPLAIIQIPNKNSSRKERKKLRFRNACCSRTRWNEKIRTPHDRVFLHACRTQTDHISFEFHVFSSDLLYFVSFEMRECVLKSIAGIFLLFQPLRNEMKPFQVDDTFALNEWMDGKQIENGDASK